MNTSLRVALDTSPEQAAKLAQLQAAFADACNALAPLVHDTRVWRSKYTGERSLKRSSGSGRSPRRARLKGLPGLWNSRRQWRDTE